MGGVAAMRRPAPHGRRSPLPAALCLLALLPVSAHAWSDETTHPAINCAAWQLWADSVAGRAPFEGSLSLTGLDWCAARVNPLGSGPEAAPTERHTAAAGVWIEHGGVSAGRPLAYMELRHFYDPTGLGGASYLTDLRGLDWLGPLLSDRDDARGWTLDNAANPHNWLVGLEAYRDALATPERHDELLCRALRCLGETMHGLADVTAPWHVRNDNHWDEGGDCLEDLVEGLSLSPYLDPSTPSLLPESEFSGPITAEALFETVATFTQRCFFTTDTVPLPNSAVTLNGQPAYEAPSVTDDCLVWEEYSPTGDGARPRMVGYSRDPRSGETRIPVVARTLGGELLGATGAVPRYTVPWWLVGEMARVELPIAVRANARLAGLFFPTLVLSGEATAASDGVAVSARLHHETALDPEWQRLGMEVRYTGPGTLTVGGRAHDTRFVDGTMQPVTLSGADLGAAAAGTLEVHAGGRVFRTTVDLDPGAAGPRIAWVSYRDGDPEVYVARLDGTHPVRISHDAGLDQEPAISADGTKVAWSSRRDGNFEIYIANTDGSGVVNVSRDGDQDSDPSLSGDGSRIGWQRWFDIGWSELLVARADGTGVRSLTGPHGGGGQITLSGDGSRVAWSASGGTYMGIVTESFGGAGRLLVSGTVGRAARPSLSTDGGRIAWSSDRDGNQEIYVANSDGSGLVNVSADAARDITPSLSGDGLTVAWCRRVGSNNEIYVARTDGAGLRNLSNSGDDDSAPSISADGTKVAWTRRVGAVGRILLCNTDGTGLVTVADSAAGEGSPSLQGN